jgi:hypothetical protein
MQKTPFTATLVCCLAIAATPCTKAPEPQQTTQIPQGNKPCPPAQPNAQLVTIQQLSCFVDLDHRLNVGNPTANAIPKDTKVFLQRNLKMRASTVRRSQRRNLFLHICLSQFPGSPSSTTTHNVRRGWNFRACLRSEIAW